MIIHINGLANGNLISIPNRWR